MRETFQLAERQTSRRDDIVRRKDFALVQANLAAAVAASGGEATAVEGIFTPA